MARVLERGPEVLSDDELAALVLGQRAGARVLRLGLRGLFLRPQDELLETLGLSPSLLAHTLAVAELLNRAQRSADTRPHLRTADDVAAHLGQKLRLSRIERFVVLAVDPGCRLLRETWLHGTVDSCPVDPREALGPALLAKATGLVFAHNHPSGNPEPSVHDVHLTQQLEEGAQALNLRVLDHVVVATSGVVSMRARGYFGGRAAHTVEPAAVHDDDAIDGDPPR